MRNRQVSHRTQWNWNLIDDLDVNRTSNGDFEVASVHGIGQLESSGNRCQFLAAKQSQKQKKMENAEIYRFPLSTLKASAGELYEMQTFH